ncbi:MAG: hypothetical protein J6V74_01765 [Bacteroidales bacterium]|nr:hypothetical protein [Bacteroidales bacterium]
MAEITIKEANTGALTPVSEIDLERITNTVLIEELIVHNVIESSKHWAWLLIGKNHIPICDDNISLSKLGFNDGDIITIVCKPCGYNHILDEI